MARYCESIFETKRWATREVKVGNVGVGGQNPVRIQSMTTSSTRDVEATIGQIMRLADNGCEIARVTVQGMKEAEACEQIKSGLLQKGYSIPLVADIHFYPPAAMRVVEFVDKVRINPGNFVDKRAMFKKMEYDDASYQEEIEKIEEGFFPLVDKCKKLKKAMRIGTNHGSLSDRIMNRYGDTPFGMVESALEFARVCRKYDFHDFIFSMKASNPLVMIQAYRLLVAEMMKLGWDYPLHLGVTEAGEGEDGRVKSAVGIGSLLLDGIGDTIRVSLTEDPWAEIDPCQRLVRLAKEQEGKGTARFEETCRDIKIISKRKVQIGDSSFLHPSGSVLLKVKGEDLKASDFYKNIGCKTQLGRPFKDLGTPDLIWVEDLGCDEKTAVVLDQLHRAQIGVVSREPGENRVLIRKIDTLDKHEDISHCIIEIEEINDHILDKMVKLRPLFFLFSSKKSLIHEGRRLMQHLRAHQNEVAVLLAPSYQGDWQDVVIKAPAECGALLTDGLFDGVCLQVSAPYEDVRLLSFNLLQACRMRTTKTEFISCPGCGRTLFDLQSVTKRIREKTAHLPGVKIAIMGCIVNGPGEMADADFGYVGSKAGKIDLYVGKECVERNIDFSEADERLVELIKSHGKWVDPVLV